MAKKHLLYIHSERFNDEKEKSGLVNMLLEKHYATELGKYGTYVEAELVDARDFTKPKVIKTIEQAQKATADIKREHTPVELCKKHGIAVSLGRTTCTMKDCK